jgi:hypothetical protein
MAVWRRGDFGQHFAPPVAIGGPTHGQFERGFAAGPAPDCGASKQSPAQGVQFAFLQRAQPPAIKPELAGQTNPPPAISRHCGRFPTPQKLKIVKPPLISVSLMGNIGFLGSIGVVGRNAVKVFDPMLNF